MQIERQDIPNVVLLQPVVSTDVRGEFVKTFEFSILEPWIGRFNVQEEFFSISRKNVIRGMHFQAPPFSLNKIVYCALGSITNVLLDLRRGSPTFGKHLSFELNCTNRAILYIPAGIANGFVATGENNCVMYKTDSSYRRSHDQGIRWNSFGFNWTIDAKESILSDRDMLLPTFDSFESPFTMPSVNP